MKLQTKVGLSILPVVLLAIVILDLWVIRVMTEGIETSTLRHMEVVLNAYVTDKVGALHTVLVKNRLDQEEAFVKDYQGRAARSADELELAEAGRILIVNASGELIFPEKDREIQAMESLWREQTLQIIQGIESSLTGHIHTLDRGYVYVARYFTPWQWVVFYIISDEEVHAAQRSIRNVTLWIAGLCALIFSTLIFAVFRTFFVKPIELLQEAASAIARGESVTKIPVFSGDELGELTRHMEFMAEAIQKHRDEQRTWQAHLEAQVKERTKALREANAELLQYAYVVSHDLQTPLRAIRNYADFLSEDLEASLEDEQRSYLDGLQQAVHEANLLIQDILEFSRVSRYEEELETIDIGAFLRSLIDSLNIPNGTEIIMSEDWPTLDVSQVLFRQIFQNLLNNAVKFNSSLHKRVDLGWRVLENGQYEFFVRDNGIGIAPQHQEKIFKVFERLHTREEFEGTGIGLAIVKKAIGKLGGSIRVDSKPGEGSTFFIALPGRHSEKI